MSHTVTAALDLPASLFREIGRVISAHSVVELSLSNIVYDLAGVDSKIGRLAIREPRAADRIDPIIKMMALKKIPLRWTMKALRKALRKEVEKGAKRQEWLTHGVWGHHPHTGVLHRRLVRGAQEIEMGKPPVSRILSPVGVPWTAENCADLANEIRQIIKILSGRHEEIRNSLSSLPQKST
jgi:hypothetical protein